METVNHARIKRQAHNISRGDTELAWSPVRHIWGPKSGEKKRRAETWDPEAGRSPELEDGDEAISPVTHAATAPDPRSTSFDGGDDEVVGPSGRDSEKDFSPINETEGSGDTTVADSQPSASGSHPHSTVRNRMHAVANGIKGKGSADHAGDDGHDSNNKEKKKKKKEHRMFKRVEPKEPFTFANQLQRTLLNSWLNVLLLAVPAGIALGFLFNKGKVDGKIVFTVNFIAIIPLAAMLSFSTEEIALRTGETLGGLLNATFGNAVELIVAIIALVDNKVRIVQTSLIGSILSNLLLVMGMCFFFGGLRRQEQFFNETVAQTAASLLALAVAAVIVPTVFDRNSDTSVADVAQLSRGTSVILLLVYAAYLFFQLKTHHAVFSQESQKVPAKPFRKRPLPDGAIARGFAGPAGIMGAHGVKDGEHKIKSALAKKVKNRPQGEQDSGSDSDDEEDHEEPQLHFWVALATLTISTVFIALCAEFMVDGIDSVTKGGGVSEEFVGLILLPIVGNAAEHATAVTVAIKDKMDLAIGVAIGSSMQVALLLIPLLVVIGWGMGKDDMNLSFDLFQVAVLFVAVLLVNYLIADGKSHWLEGMLLICLYAIIAVCSWWYPPPTTDGGESS